MIGRALEFTVGLWFALCTVMCLMSVHYPPRYTPCRYVNRHICAGRYVYLCISCSFLGVLERHKRRSNLLGSNTPRPGKGSTLSDGLLSSRLQSVSLLVVVVFAVVIREGPFRVRYTDLSCNTYTNSPVSLSSIYGSLYFPLFVTIWLISIQYMLEWRVQRL